jgi:hypothetical protein
MPTKRKNNNMRSSFATPPEQGSVTATIDLHGYRKSEGIIALTAFLDRVVSQATKQQGNTSISDIWVLVITGSGAHSPEGPVLRTAIQSVLEKRNMQFLVNRGRGSFTVNANSGVVFYEPGMPVDSKVIVKEAPEVIPKLPKPPRLSSMARPVHEDEAPTPHEVAATDKAIEESKKDQQRIFQEQKKEEQIIKRAVSMSLLQVQKEEEEEHQLVQRALSLSLLDTRADATALDDDLQRALELSQKDFHHDESEEIERALRLSQQIACREDEELLQILELSKQEYQLNGSWTIGCGADVESDDT